MTEATGDDEFHRALEDLNLTAQESAAHKQLSGRHMSGLLTTGIEHGIQLTAENVDAIEFLANSMATVDLQGYHDDVPDLLKAIALGGIAHGISEEAIDVFALYCGVEILTDEDEDLIADARAAATERANRFDSITEEISELIIEAGFTDAETSDPKYNAFLRYLENACYGFRYVLRDKPANIRRINLIDELQKIAQLLQIETKVMPIVISLLTVDP